MIYDNIVIGSGISGLTMAMILAMNGESVLILEKSDKIGGLLGGFYRNGIYFDTGFHFAGGLAENEFFRQALDVLGLSDCLDIRLFGCEDTIEYLFADKKEANCFNHTDRKLDIGLKELFPKDSKSVSDFFKRIENIALKSRLNSLNEFLTGTGKLSMEEDYISLDNVLSGLFKSEKIKSILSGYNLCYGVKPSEISFADHCRICYYLYKSPGYFKYGGRSLLKAFENKLSKYRVEIKISDCILDVGTSDNGRNVRNVTLNSGEILECKRCIFTIHPYMILETLKNAKLSAAFRKRVSNFEPSLGFFSVYGTLKSDRKSVHTFSHKIIYPSGENMNSMMGFRSKNRAMALFIQPIDETTGGETRKICALESSYAEDISDFIDLDNGKKSDRYYEYKEQKTLSIKDRVDEYLSLDRNDFRVLDSASMLTYKQYLNSPYGCAYGIKQKIGQFNLLGRLPIRNVFAAGQSAALPGLLGAMMSSFIVAKNIIGEDKFMRFVEGTIN